MAGMNKMRALNRLPYDFEDGLKIGGVDVTTLNQMSTANGAGLVGFTPVGNLGSTNVQAAIAELDVEKVDNAALADTEGAALVGYDGGNVRTVLDNAKSLQDYTALRVYTGRAASVRILATGVAGFFYYDNADTSSVDNGGTIIVSSNGRRWKRHYEGAVNVKWFGAKGNGVDDDSLAFVTANTYVMTKSLPVSNQLVESQYVTLQIPEGVYNLTGHRIFGSVVATGQTGTSPPRMLQIYGQGATLVWNVQNESDELFYFDGTIAYPKIQGLSIFTTRSTIINSGAGIIFRFYANLSISNQANAGKLHMTDVAVWPGRHAAGGSLQRAKCIFLNTGDAMCDRMLIDNCRFLYMQKVYDGQNDQAVNVTFSSCSFAGLSNDNVASPTTYFDFTRMNDNFNVLNCSFGVQSGETLIRTNSPILGGFYQETGGYNFNFDNNRIEIINGSGANVNWKFCDMNFGKLNVRNTNLNLGNASSSVRTIVKSYELANTNFDNVQFNLADFVFPVATSPSFVGLLNPYGAYFRNCVFSTRANTTFSYSNGVTNYNIKEVFVSSPGLYWRGARFVDCNYLNENGFYTWEFVNAKSDLPIAPRKIEKISFSKAGIAFGREFLLPPFQSIKRITLSMPAALPDTRKIFRVWIGDRTLISTFDVGNIRPDIRKNEYILFEGDATVFHSDTALQSIEVASLTDGVEVNNDILSWINVEYEPLDARAYGLTTTDNTVQILRFARNASSGATSQRPTVDLYVTQPYFDLTLGKPIWWNGAVWKDAAGTTV